jgi:type VI secretion system protein ImpJ
MRQMQPVLWTKGVLLSPQHLQTQDHYLENQLRFRVAALQRYPWGMRELALDRDALAAGSLRVERAVAIFPDGLLYDAPAEDDLPAARPLAACWRGQDQRHLDVYLAVPHERPGGGNVDLALRPDDVSLPPSPAQNGGGAPAAPRSGHGTRYVGEPIARRDATTGLAERPVQVARKNVRLVVDGEPIEGHTTIRLGRVRRDANGHCAFDPRVVAPLLDFAASDVLLALGRHLVELLAAKSAALAAGRRQRNLELAEFGAADVAQFWYLYTVNSFLPQLRHLVETRRGHPEGLFASMLALAGVLTTFAPDGAPLPAYDHDDLGGAFHALDARLRELLETALPQHAVSLRLPPLRPSVVGTRLDDDRYLVARQVYLAVAADIGRADLVRLVPQLVKLSSSEYVEPLIRRGLPGVSLSHTSRLPAAVAARSDYEYFAVAMTGPAWDAVRQARNVAVYVPGDLPNPRLELVIVLAAAD